MSAGIRTQIEVADIGGNGKLDLLLGDFSSCYEAKKNLNHGKWDRLQNLIAEMDAQNATPKTFYAPEVYDVAYEQLE